MSPILSTFTDRAGKPLIINDANGTPVIGSVRHSVVYINRSCASNGTLVHELLHAISNSTWYLWAMMKTPNTNEGVTEWLTRKALKHAGDAAFQNIDRSASYQSDFQNLKAAKGTLKLSDPQIGASIQSAYFGGHITEDLDTFVGAFMSAGLIATQSNAVFAATAFGGRGGRRKY